MDNNELLKAVQDLFEKKIDEVKRHTGVFFEDLRGEIKAIAEGHSVLDRKIDALQKDLFETKQELKHEIYGLKKDMATVKDFVIGVDEKLNEHEIIIKNVK